MIVSCIRVQTIATYGNSANPTFDSLEAALYSVVEQNVGVICICMPNVRVPDTKKSSQKPKRSTLSASLFQSNITKTTETRVTSEQMDDEVRLVELQRARTRNTPVGTTNP